MRSLSCGHQRDATILNERRANFIDHGDRNLKKMREEPKLDGSNEELQTLLRQHDQCDFGDVFSLLDKDVQQEDAQDDMAQVLMNELADVDDF